MQGVQGQPCICGRQRRLVWPAGEPPAERAAGLRRGPDQRRRSEGMQTARGCAGAELDSVHSPGTACSTYSGVWAMSTCSAGCAVRVDFVTHQPDRRLCSCLPGNSRDVCRPRMSSNDVAPMLLHTHVSGLQSNCSHAAAWMACTAGIDMLYPARAARQDPGCCYDLRRRRLRRQQQRTQCSVQCAAAAAAAAAASAALAGDQLPEGTVAHSACCGAALLIFTCNASSLSAKTGGTLLPAMCASSRVAHCSG